MSEALPDRDPDERCAPASPLGTRVDMSQGRYDGDDIGLPLRGVTQEHLHTPEMPGDCQRAALASILGLPYEDVPHFCRYGDGLESPDKHIWWWALVGFCATLEPPYDVMGLKPDQVPEPSESYDDLFGCYMAIGKSPRGDYNHVVVARGGQIIWDPHPSRAGLDGEPVEIDYLVRRSVAIGDAGAPSATSGEAGR